MFKKYFLLTLLLSNSVLPMDNDNAKTSGMSTTKKVLIGGAIGVGVVGGAVLLGPVVLPAATIAAIKTAAVSAAVFVKGAVVSAVSQSSIVTSGKALVALAGGAFSPTEPTKGSYDFLMQPAAPIFTISKVSPFVVTKSAPETSSLFAKAAKARQEIDAIKVVAGVATGVRDEIVALNSSRESEPCLSAQEKQVDKFEREKEKRKSFTESINLVS